VKIVNLTIILTGAKTAPNVIPGTITNLTALNTTNITQAAAHPVTKLTISPLSAEKLQNFLPRYQSSIACTLKKTSKAD
jgi:hypothetical protein